MAGLRLTIPVVCVVAGFAAGWLVLGARNVNVGEDMRGDEIPTAGAGSAAAPAGRVPPTSSDPPLAKGAPVLPGAAPAPAPVALPSGSSASLPAPDTPLVADLVIERAHAIREAARHQEETADQVARAQVLHEIEKERARRIDLERDGTMAFLQGLSTDWQPQAELVSEPSQFARLFEHRTAPASVSGSTLTGQTEIRDGDRILFGRGLHRLDVSAWNRMPRFPQDVSIEGVGMDDTCIVLDDEFRMRGDIHSFTLRDLTVHCNDHYLTALRNGAFTLRIDRCRIVGFDMGAGGSSMLSGSVGALYMTNSRIEAGFGRSPGFGNLFDVRGALLVRMEDCEVVGPFRSVHYQWPRASHVFVRCRFLALPENMRTSLERATNVRAVDCTFEYLPAADRGRADRRPITEINPYWK